MMSMRISALILVLGFLCLLSGAQQPQSTNPPSGNSQSTNPPSASSAASAQTEQSPASTDQSQGKIVSAVDIVNVIFTVQDDQGRYVQDLTRDQFRILDNNKPPREITSFDAQTGLPLRVVLIIDVSNSVRDRLQFEQQAATEFLQQTLDLKTDRAMVESFDEVYEVLQDFTSDLDKLSSSLRTMVAGGSTAMWDAVYYACREKLMKQQNSGPVRNVIVLISDGNDTQSHVYRQEAIDMAQRAEATVYTVSTNLGFSQDEGDHNLRMLSEATGGQAFFPAALDDVETAFVHIQHELRSQYSVSYKPDNFVANGAYRTILIKSVHDGLKVRSKRGYYARKQ
jgi:Ca-activated chloride channel homolog